MLVKTSGIVLHYLKYSDSSIIAYIYTEYAGRQSFLLQGVRSKRASNKINLLQPLHILDMEVYHRTGRDLQKVKEVKSKVILNSLALNPYKTAIALFLAELLYKVLKEQEANPKLFGFLENSIEVLDVLENNFANFHLLFLVQLSKYLGFYPNNNYSAKNNVFDLQNGNFTDILPLHPYYISQSLSEKLSLLLSSGLQSDLPVKLGGEMRASLLDKLILYYSLQIPGLDNFRSLEVLKEVFHS